LPARYCTCTIIIFAAPCRPSPAHLASAYSSQYPPAPVIRPSMPLHARLHNQLTSYTAPYKAPYYSPYYTASPSSNLLYPPPALPRQHTRQDQKSGILPSVVADVGQKQRLLLKTSSPSSVRGESGSYTAWPILLLKLLAVKRSRCFPPPVALLPFVLPPSSQCAATRNPREHHSRASSSSPSASRAPSTGASL
jgi:hypothetical protein